MEKSMKMNALSLGVCYYPEHWDEALWQDDLRRMAAHGIHTVRVFEFAWSIVEPRENAWDFSLFDRFLALAAREKTQVILCTPTATPPAWLTDAHPEVLNKTKDGQVMYHGHRRHYTYNSPVYNAYVETIVTALAKRYGNHPAVIGWQIDNEINCEINEFYSDADHTAFRTWLQTRFATLEAFNEAIGARFWNQTYDCWDEVYLERYTPRGQGNPHLALLGKEFFSESAIRFVKRQSDILRAYIKKQFITTNGIFGHLDSHRMTQMALDFIMYDSYPSFAYAQGASMQDALKDRKWSMHLSQVRALSPNFGVMEQQSGAGGWDFTMMAPMPLPGQMRLWTLQSVAHGADYISYFRWRTAPYGTEIYWHGLNDYDNRDNRRLEELQHVQQAFERLADVAGSRYEAKIAILTDCLNEWDGERDQWYGPMSKQSTEAIFAAAQHTHTPLDFVNLSAVSDASALANYHIIFYPHAAILTGQTAELLQAYCEQGGTLVMGARTGYKDEYGRCPMRPMPGPASGLCGVTVGEYTVPHPLRERELIWSGMRYEAPGFQETLEPAKGTDVIARFSDQVPGMTCKSYASGGAAYYIGCGFTEAFTTAILRELHLDEPYASLVKCPAEVELGVRRKGNTRYIFLLNYSESRQTVVLQKSLYEMISAQQCMGEIMILPFGVSVLRDACSS